MSAYEELLIKIKTASELSGFDNLEGKVKQAQTDMRSMESTTNASARKMKTDLDQVNNTNFSSLNSKFTSTISSMASTAASGAKAIKTTLSNMVDGIDGAITSVAAGMGTMELFENAMSKALTQTQLKNAKPQDYSTIMDQYQRFTTASSASDEDINKMLRFTYSGNSSETYKALNAVDAISYSADKLQRAEGIRGWGTYLSGGWNAASGMMRDEPLTGDQVKLLQKADTYDERVAAMEEIAKQKGNVDKFGNSLSTTVDGPLGKYNQALAAEDAITRGATASFETLMTWIAPVISAFMGLDPAVQSTIGTVLTAGIVVTAAASGLGILVKVLSPVGTVLSGGIGKLKDALSGAKDVKDKVSGLKNALDGSKLVSTVSIKAGVVNVNGKTTGSSTTTPSTVPTPNKPKIPTPTPDEESLASKYVKYLKTAGQYGIGAVLLGGIVGGVALSGAIQGEIQTKGEIGSWQQHGLIQGTPQYKPQDHDPNDFWQWSDKQIYGAPAWISGGLSSTWNDIIHPKYPLFNFGKAPSINGQPFNPAGTILGGLTSAGSGIWGRLTDIFSPVSAASPTGPGATLPAGTKSVQSATINPNTSIFPNVDAQGWINDNISKPITDWWNGGGIRNIVKDWKLPNIDAQGAVNTLKTDVTNGWNSAKDWVMSNPVIGGAITQVDNLLHDHKKAWGDAKNWVLSNPTIGKAWADAYALYSNVKSWWDAARRYVNSHTITATVDHTQFISGGGGGGFAGDEGADAGLGQGPYAEKETTSTSSDYVPYIAPVTTKTITTSDQRTIAPVFNIDSIDSKETADYFIQKVTQHLSDINDSKGN